jgi:hypothetical protein
MDNFRLWSAAVLAMAAAARLLMWRWHVKRDKAWLAERFGRSDENGKIAEKHSMAMAAWFAGCAVVALCS